jgi:hypothetical protein
VDRRPAPKQVEGGRVVTNIRSEYFETSSKKGRGMAQASHDLIKKMYSLVKRIEPVTGRGVGYKLFVAELIASMAKNDMARVYRLLRQAREQGTIPWEWIVDENRSLDRVATWDNPKDYARYVARSYRRDFWNQQPVRCELWSEKGTVRGVLEPVLDEFAVGFMNVIGFSGATPVHDTAEDNDGRPLIILYVGDYDPSGLFMSEVDLPKRFAKYGGDHIKLKRIALTQRQVSQLPSFPAADKKKDPRYKWFLHSYGRRCWELDAMDPNDLRACVKREIKKLIEPTAWARCEMINEAERDSLETVMNKWKGATS